MLACPKGNQTALLFFCGIHETVWCSQISDNGISQRVQAGLAVVYLKLQHEECLGQENTDWTSLAQDKN